MQCGSRSPPPRTKRYWSSTPPPAQNGISQASKFTEAVDCTGIVLAKLDGTAKGGVVVAIRKQVGLPVKYIGVGESIEDLAVFRPDEFVDALFDEMTSGDDDE